MHTKIQSTWRQINMELKENLLEIEKKSCQSTKNVRQIYKSTLHHGGKAETDEGENEIVGWILINRSFGINVSS